LGNLDYKARAAIIFGMVMGAVLVIIMTVVMLLSDINPRKNNG
jgi:hypothetical protein